jgi:HD superfamily phosphohydrolase
MDIYKKGIERISQVHEIFMSDVDRTIHDMTTKLLETISQLTNENDTICKLNSELEELVSSLNIRLQDMTEQLESCQEEQREFLKVSRFVAIEKENAKLKLEIAELKEKLNTAKEDRKEDKQCDVEFRKKKINDNYYYVNKNEVYEINEDDSIGQLVGRIEGKKVKWL